MGISDGPVQNPPPASPQQVLEQLKEMTDQEADNRALFSTGAVRSKDADDLRYDLIPPGPLKRLARRYAIGAAKYGDHNWLRGFPAGDVFKHLMKHLEAYRAGDREDDHLAAVAWGVFALMHYESTGRDDLLYSYHYFYPRPHERLPDWPPGKCPECDHDLSGIRHFGCPITGHFDTCPVEKEATPTGP